MKLVTRVILTGVLGMGLCSPAWAYFIDSTDGNDDTDVGSIDTYISETSGMSSGEQTEIDWVNGELGTSFDSLTKTEDVKWYNTSETVAGPTSLNVIAFGLQQGPGYYLIKNARVHVLFENLTSLDWGVIDLGDISGDINLGDDMMISHVSEFGDGPTEVPAPGLIALFGVGLLGLAGAGALRRRG